MSGRRVLVVGGTGFIGTHVTRALAAAGHAVTVYHRGCHEPTFRPGVRHVRSDDAAIPVMRYPDRLRAARFDAVVLMTPIGEADTRAAADAFRGRAGRLVVVSSADVYAAYGRLLGREPSPTGEEGAGDDRRALDEEAPLRAELYPYGRSARGPWGGELRDYDKILVERVALGDPALPGTVLRLPAVFGQGDRQRRFAGWVRRMADGRPFVLLGARQARWRWTHGYVENVAAAVAHAAVRDAAAGRVYNVGEARTPTVVERVAALARAVGWMEDVVTVPDARLPAHLREPVSHAVDLALDTSRMRRELGFAEPVDADEALRRTVRWLRAEGAMGAAGVPATSEEDDLPARYAAEDAAADAALPAARQL